MPVKHETKMFHLRSKISLLLQQKAKVLVFTRLASDAEEIAGMLKDYEPMLWVGRTPSKTRSAHAKNFQNGGLLLIGTYSAMGTGVCLNKAQFCFFLNADMVEPRVIGQALGRVHRFNWVLPCIEYSYDKVRRA